MTLEKIPEYGKVAHNEYECPDCGERTLWIHDLKCGICDNFSVVWCPNCEAHYKVKEE